MRVMRRGTFVLAILLLLLSVYVTPRRPVEAAPLFPPSPSPRTLAHPSPSPHRKRPGITLRLSSLYPGDASGYPRHVFYTVEPAVYLYASIAPLQEGAAKPSRVVPRLLATGSHEFWLRIEDSTGHRIARIGGSLPAGLDLRHADLPLDCKGAPPNGLSINGGLLRAPGRYHVQAFLDGLAAGETWFTVKRLYNRGRILVTSAAVENAKGDREQVFSTRERGIYAHVTLVNRSEAIAHEHLLYVAFVGPQGQEGRMFGGLLHVSRCEWLDGIDFPQACDRRHHDGILVAGTPVAKETGAWTMVLYIDGYEVRELHFQLKQAQAVMSQHDHPQSTVGKMGNREHARVK